MDNVFVHKRVNKAHPEIADQDVLIAWKNCVVARPRIDKSPDEYLAIGIDGHGRTLEMVAKRSAEGTWLLYHAMIPPSAKTLRELGLDGDNSGQEKTQQTVRCYR